MEENYIHSRQNSQIKNLVKLRDRKYRDRQESFLIEGLRELGHAITANYEIQAIYYCPECFPTDDHTAWIDKIRIDRITELVRVSKDVFAKVSHREGPDGIIAVANQRSHSIQQLSLPELPLLLILEGIEKPGNLGAILRSAEGAGVDAVILVDCVLDLYNPNAIRSSQGLIFSIPIIQAEQTYLSTWLSEKKIQCVATTPDSDQLYWDIDYNIPTAFFFGSESDGLTDYWLKNTAHPVSISMAGKADSLNVAAAAAICLYEARRQRFKGC